MNVYAYLRASTKEQDATRARSAIYEFATSHNLSISGEYVENESGASLSRPELFKLIDQANKGDVLLTEQVDRLSRLDQEDWTRLKETITAKGIRVVAMDLPTSHMMLNTGDEFTSRMYEAINGMMLDMLAAIARKDYVDRRRRQAEGIASAKAKGVRFGKVADKTLHKRIQELYGQGMKKVEIAKQLGVSRPTIDRALKMP
ncbi:MULTISPECIES: recombinase family protein [Enterobacter cloacae complex]|uniref:recombinase family protein n=1 Tax=Enterobacter cloacae complex TaxID=354276 RepID=UPI001010783F|nr:MULTISPECIES: recombinase family protein [Enterobacter cloacae complex]MDQ6584433.1 recombinase family protein [Enterobacter hormaechei]RYA41454.1 resolvase [Enterobacter cloacae complex sp. 2DZ2F2B]RYA45736.1 resolvase [Enterobacter cloacae complex sp. 3DZ3S2B]